MLALVLGYRALRAVFFATSTSFRLGRTLYATPEASKNESARLHDDRSPLRRRPDATLHLPANRDQLDLFDTATFFVEQSGRHLHRQPRVTGGDRIGFSHDVTPSVFLGRQGDGPLIICPDTNVLTSTRPCSVHPAPQRIHSPTPVRWPHAKDRALLADALQSGCHVFLTCDKGVLACAGAFARCGLSIMTPRELLEGLDRDRQLDLVPEWPVDLDSIARFYGIALAVDEVA